MNEKQFFSLIRDVLKGFPEIVKLEIELNDGTRYIITDEAVTPIQKGFTYEKLFRDCSFPN